jgi:hypothetical protein
LPRRARTSKSSTRCAAKRTATSFRG